MTRVGAGAAEVAVVGAGPVGLSAALAARALGLTTVLLEAEPPGTVRAGSRAIFVHRATLDRLDRVSPGLGERIAAQGLVWGTKRTLWAGREVHARHYRPAADGPPPFTSLPQTEVERMLREACAAAGVVTVAGDPVVSVRAGRSPGVRVTARSGAEYRAGFVIGADGSRSRVREEAGIALEGSSSATEFVVIDVADGPEPAPPERVFHYRHPAVGGRNVLLVPFRGGWRVDIQCRIGDNAQELTARAAEWLPAVLPPGAGTEVTWSSVYRFQRRLAREFADPTGRILLAGEAAHLLPPFGARGMNSGIADALAAAQATREGAVAVARYARDRRAAAERNIFAAGAALDHLLAGSLRRRLVQRGAAALSPLSTRAGHWLDAAPYGPRLRSVRY
ncbi:FAD-dependent monooxygenase [Kitasatospora azatica]|uniref:FAD-dependent monooxygenase n=1 Tax=Kitasatospora azatica TaxID=58347 RepID=UPI001E444897|nr:FAD-dependent monooxygenase [Kitasatospora azatica]